MSDAFGAFGALERAPWSALMLLHAAAGGVPCVILSAPDARSFDGFAERGFAGLVRKPFDIDGLVAAREARADLPLAPLNPRCWSALAIDGTCTPID